MGITAEIDRHLLGGRRREEEEDEKKMLLTWGINYRN